MEQKRLFERIAIPLKIKYQVIENPPLIKDTTSKDLSGGGIRLALEENLPVGTHLKLDIEIPEEKNKTMTAYGKIVWVNKGIEITGKKSSNYYETGIQFTKVDPVILGKIFKTFPEK